MTAVDMEVYKGFRVGDNVWISANPRHSSVQWVITALFQAVADRVYATVRSPHSSRSRVVPISKLTLHSKAGVA